jgi:hypothetical protein
MFRSHIGWKWRLVIIAAAVIAYAPCLNNGFIADDFILLNRVEILKTNPYYLVEVTPEPFRLTSYVALGILKGFFGYDYRLFYAFNILLHALNSLLLAELALQLTGELQISVIASVLFAVFQAPQEAIMWIGAMNETLLGFFVLLTLLLWVRGHYRSALASYSLALVSKESALVILLIVPLIELYRGRHAVYGFWRQYMWLFLPTSVFGFAFLLTLSKNFMVNNRIHAVSWHALIVLPNSIHRLLWPWAYAVLALLWITKSAKPSMRGILRAAALMASALVPYIFVAHTYNIPSRHNYLASAVVAVALSSMMLRLPARALRNAVLASFILVNIAYIWIRKDSQMERRAAPTTALLDELRKRPPGPVRLIGFEYAPASDMAKGAAITLPGWHWNDVELIPPADRCAGCTILEWDPSDRRYIER